MRKITIRRKHKKNSLQGWLIWFALTAAFSLMGFSLAAFNQSLYISGSMETAECIAEITGSSLSAISLADREENGSDNIKNQGDSSDFFTYKVSSNSVVQDQSTGSNGKTGKNAEPVLKVSNDDKNIRISIENAYPGDVYRLRYWIENKGTIPIELVFKSVSDHSHLAIENTLFSGEYIEPRGSVSEELLITVSDNVEGQQNYNFSIELSYSQWKGN